ncbi:MAG: hypothetical protein II919_03270 [Lachnospiraceae bacterium]|nr:hypothetical protein [Lachnospiraceae bacterium]
MKWYNNLYVGENAKKRKHKIIMRTKLNKPQIGTYLITLPLNDKNSLEIYPSYILMQKHYRKQNMMVVGIGLGRDEAFLVMQDIIMDCYQKTGQFLVRKMVDDEL